MITAFSARDIMQVFIVGVTALLLLHLFWPRALARSIKWESQGNKVGGFLSRNVSAILFGFGILFALALFAGFVHWNNEWAWTDTEPALTSIAIVAGVVFGYIKLFAPPFWPAYHEVDIWERPGDWRNEKIEELTIGKNSWSAIFLLVHNTGVAPWNNYRITVKFEDGFEIRSETPEVVGSEGWGWKTRGLRFIPERTAVQLQAENTLAVGEPQTIRFVLKSPDQTGKFKVRISLVCDGRLSESSRELWLNVPG